MEQFAAIFELITGVHPLEALFSVVVDFVQPDEVVMTTPKARVIHSIPGRLRLKVTNRRGDKQFYNELASKVQEMPSVKSVQTNAVTGSVLVKHDGSVETLLAEAVTAGLHDVIELEFPEDEPAVPVATKLVERIFQVDDRMKRVSGGHLDAQSATLTMLLVAGAFQLARGNWFGPAIPLFWYATQAAGLLPQPTARSHSAV